MKKCPFCAEEIQDEAILCRYCGRELSPDVERIHREIGTKKPWYRQTWFYIICFFVFWPIFVILVLSDSHASRWLKGFAILYLIIFLGTICLVVFSLLGLEFFAPRTMTSILSPIQINSPTSGSVSDASSAVLANCTCPPATKDYVRGSYGEAICVSGEIVSIHRSWYEGGNYLFLKTDVDPKGYNFKAVNQVPSNLREGDLVDVEGVAEVGTSNILVNNFRQIQLCELSGRTLGKPLSTYTPRPPSGPIFDRIQTVQACEENPNCVLGPPSTVAPPWKVWTPDSSRGTWTPEP